MLKTNVIKKDYILMVRNAESNETQMITVNAESLESAKLKIPEGWEFVEYAKIGNTTGEKEKQCRKQNE